MDNRIITESGIASGMCRLYFNNKEKIMKFHTFSSQKERQSFGGSYFIEMQYCRSDKNSSIAEIISVDSIEPWADDSLYIHGDDDNEFVSIYGGIFTGGTYANGENGPVDMCGINYYPCEQTKLIIEKIKEAEPSGTEALLEWLKKAEEYNGFYILGL